jgi:hypothetical protein
VNAQEGNATLRSVDARRRETALAILERRSRSGELSRNSSPELQAQTPLKWIVDLLAFRRLFVEELLEPIDLLPLRLAVRHDDLLALGAGDTSIACRRVH